MDKRNLDVIVYPTQLGDPLAKYTWNLFDRFYAACGSSRIGVIKFIRGLNKNWWYDSLKLENGKWPSVNAEVWYNIPLGDLICNAYMGSQKAARSLLLRYKKSCKN